MRNSGILDIILFLLIGILIMKSINDDIKYTEQKSEIITYKQLVLSQDELIGRYEILIKNKDILIMQKNEIIQLLKN